MSENISDANRQVRISKNEVPFDDVEIFEMRKNPPLEMETLLIPGVAETVSSKTLLSVLDNLLNTDAPTRDMTNLGNVLLGHADEADAMNDDTKIGRLSLAHEKLTYMPNVITDEFGPYIKILDITDNNLKNMDFLEHFLELTSLIADKNPITSIDTNIPWMPKLELLYLNHCKIDDLYWVETLRYNCPNLKFLSLMNNPIVPALMTAENMYEYLQYRFYVISAIPSLIHLDDKKITDDERIQAKLMFPTPFVENLVKTTKAWLPHYLRRFSDRMSDCLSRGSVSSNRSSGKSLKKSDRNLII